MDPPELASEPPQSRIELRAGVKRIGLDNVRANFAWAIERLYPMSSIYNCRALT